MIELGRFWGATRGPADTLESDMTSIHRTSRTLGNPMKPRAFDGKEGVDGSSPSEGLSKRPLSGRFCVPRTLGLGSRGAFLGRRSLEWVDCRWEEPANRDLLQQPRPEPGRGHRTSGAGSRCGSGHGRWAALGSRWDHGDSSRRSTAGPRWAQTHGGRRMATNGSLRHADHD
jgi:hypothetical protein